MLAGRLGLGEVEEMRLARAREEAFEPGVNFEFIVQCDAVGGPAFVSDGRQSHRSTAHGSPTQAAVGRLQIMDVPVQIDAVLHGSPGGVQDSSSIQIKQRILELGALACREQIG